MKRKRAHNKWVLPALAALWIAAIAAIVAITVALKAGGPEALRVDQQPTDQPQQKNRDQ